jgi:putative hydrolase of the HAD superfamily
VTAAVHVPGPHGEGDLHPALPHGDRIDAISLDLDDTLWPVMPALVAAEQAMHAWLQERAPATAALCSIERIREIRVLVAMAHADRAHDMGWLRLESLRRALHESGDDPALAIGAFNEFMDGRQCVTPYPDVEPLLRRWKSRYKLLLVTNGNADNDRIGLGHFFDARAVAHQVGVGKPDRRIFDHACEQAGVAPSRVLHVGDDLELDVRGARAAGMHAAWLRRPDLLATSEEAVDDADARAEPVFADLSELDRALQAGRP